MSKNMLRTCKDKAHCHSVRFKTHWVTPQHLLHGCRECKGRRSRRRCRRTRSGGLRRGHPMQLVLHQHLHPHARLKWLHQWLLLVRLLSLLCGDGMATCAGWFGRDVGLCFAGDYSTAAIACWLLGCCAHECHPRGHRHLGCDLQYPRVGSVLPTWSFDWTWPHMCHRRNFIWCL